MNFRRLFESIEYNDYEDFPKSLAMSYTKKELENELKKLKKISPKDLDKLGNASKRNSDSMNTAQMRNVVNFNYDRKRHLEQALEIYAKFPMYTKEFKQRKKISKSEILKGTNDGKISLDSKQLEKYLKDVYQWGYDSYFKPDPVGRYNSIKMNNLVEELIIKKVNFKDIDKIINHFRKGVSDAADKDLRNKGFYD